MSVPKYLKFELPVLLKPQYTNIDITPNRANQTDAGADLKANEYTNIAPGGMALISTGVSIKIPMGYVGLVFSKSGQALKGISLGNSVGVIDSDYRGEIKVPLVNRSESWYPVVAGQKIAQIVVMPIMLPTFTKWNEVAETWIDTERGLGGFGSTGL